jgi:hypothetical protein
MLTSASSVSSVRGHSSYFHPKTRIFASAQKYFHPASATPSTLYNNRHLPNEKILSKNAPLVPMGMHE